MKPWQTAVEKRWIRLAAPPTHYLPVAGSLRISIVPLFYPFNRAQLRMVRVKVLHGHVYESWSASLGPFVQLRLGNSIVETPVSSHRAKPEWNSTHDFEVLGQEALLLHILMRDDNAQLGTPIGAVWQCQSAGGRMWVLREPLALHNPRHPTTLPTHFGGSDSGAVWLGWLGWPMWLGAWKKHPLGLGTTRHSDTPKDVSRFIL